MEPSPIQPRQRCGWAKGELDTAYHDEEWGAPQHDDIVLFEFLVLEGAQAGLSWSTILGKRNNYRKAFSGFNPSRVAKYNPERISRLLTNPGIVRNRLKVESAVQNARAFLAVQKEFGTFDSYIWQFTGGKPLVNRRRSMSEVPAQTPESTLMSKDLLRRGFKFVGPTICYAFMQATGMVNDHLLNCFRYAEIQGQLQKS